MNNDIPQTKAAKDLESLMAMVDMMNEAKAEAKTIENIKFEDVSRTTWSRVVVQMQLLQLICDGLIEIVPNAAKIVTNEALQAHINAVQTAD